MTIQAYWETECHFQTCVRPYFAYELLESWWHFSCSWMSIYTIVLCLEGAWEKVWEKVSVNFLGSLLSEMEIIYSFFSHMTALLTQLLFPTFQTDPISVPSWTELGLESGHCHQVCEVNSFKNPKRTVRKGTSLVSVIFCFLMRWSDHLLWQMFLPSTIVLRSLAEHE